MVADAAHRGALTTVPAGGGGAVPVQSLVLTRAQERYCLARAEGQNKKRAAEQAGVSERALYKWLAKPALAAALDERIDALQAAHLAALRQYLRGKATMAAARLVHIARRSKDEGEARKAAETILRLTGVEVPTPQRQAGAGPRIVIQRAVLAFDREPAGPVCDGSPRPADGAEVLGVAGGDARRN